MSTNSELVQRAETIAQQVSQNKTEIEAMVRKLDEVQAPSIASSKEDIRQAIIEKGQEVDTSVPFSEYGNKIRKIEVSEDLPESIPSITNNIVTIPVGKISENKEITVGTAKAAKTYTPSTKNQTIAKDTYLTGVQTIKGDANLIAQNIKSGVSIFSVSGTFTSDADATSGDIALGKTAYVKGEKVTGTLTATGSGVTKLYVSSQSNTNGRLYPIDVTSGWCSSRLQKPERRGANTYYIVVDGKLFYYTAAHNGSTDNRTRAVSDETGWLMFSDGVGVKDGELYTVTETTNTPEIKILTDTPKNIVQMGRAISGRQWCVEADGTAHLIYPFGDRCVVSTLDGIKIAKLLKQNQTDYYSYSQPAIDSDGRLVILTGEYHELGGEPHYVSFEVLSQETGWVNYYNYKYEDYGMGGGVYCLALKADGTLYYHDSSSLNLSVASGAPKFRTENFLGYCECEVSEEWDNEIEDFVYIPQESSIALHIDQDGKLWKISASCNSSGSLTGIKIEQIGVDDDWQYVPPYMRRSDKAFAQKGGKLYVLTTTSSSDKIDVSMSEYYIHPAGKLISVSSSEDYLWFAEDGVTVDVTTAGGTY